MTSSHPTSPVGAALAFALLASACASGAGKTSARPASGSTALVPAGGSVWTRTGLRPIGQPRAVGPVVVGIVAAADRRLVLVGIDPATGRELWEQPVTPSRATRGVVVDFAKVGEDKVAFLRPTADTDAGSAVIVVADARTGADIAKSPEALFTSMLVSCSSSFSTTRITRTAVRRPRWVFSFDIAPDRTEAPDR